MVYLRLVILSLNIIWLLMVDAQRSLNFVNVREITSFVAYEASGFKVEPVKLYVRIIVPSVTAYVV